MSLNQHYPTSPLSISICVNKPSPFLLLADHISSLEIEISLRAMLVEMSNPTKDLFSSPALSLSLAGIFRGDHNDVASAAMVEVEPGDEGSGGGRRDEMLEISSENSGPMRSRTDDEYDGEEGGEEDDGHGHNKKKKRKKYHRHTAEQIREMEALFKEAPHPDEKQRQHLSKQLGLAPRQVKFWFQNRRTQIKAIQERHENSLLKAEIEKLREESKAMRETIGKSCCPNCGIGTTSSDRLTTEEQQLRLENLKLKAEVDKLRTALGEHSPGATASCSTENEQENRSSLEFYSGIFKLEKQRILEIVNQAMKELKKMASAGEPLWIRSVETGREILNYDEYVRQFGVDNQSSEGPKKSIEASRETGVVFMDLPQLVRSFMDVTQWKEMFPCLISKADTITVVCKAEVQDTNGEVQLMFAEVQMLTPMVSTREMYFARYCRQLSAEKWAIVDVSIDNAEDSNNASSLIKCRKRPSGCIIEDKSNGHCKVIWVEHLECEKSTVHNMYRSVINSGAAFGAQHWVATLQLQCERRVFFMATNVPTKDSTGVATLAGRKSILKLAQRMTWNFCRAIGASSSNAWSKVASKTGDDVRISSRKNLNDLGEPTGIILCAVSSIWMPVSPLNLFDFLRDEAHRKEWDATSRSCGSTAQPVANLAKGQHRGNAVTIHAMKSSESDVWMLQDSCINAYESIIVFAPVDVSQIQSVITGCDSLNIAVLPSGFSILPDGVESRPLVITSRQEDKGTDGGSFLTIALQLLTNACPTAKLSMESVDSINSLVSETLQNIRTSLRCEDES